MDPIRRPGRFSGRAPTARTGGRANVPTGSSRVMNDALAAAAAGNFAIYPLNLAGLDVADADLIQAPGLIRSPLRPDLYSMSRHR